ncbi:hypothetical protein HMPREF0673_01167 [Leyella stercorea DSM 18206]|uniref:Uncharacterized protein n=1 Tax=Leyella stercorea DSM 18206 TaxID=1002367 RepID=G6AX17_9BACT|nr:hypothetical protein HMPREF0673_01167 [Leyella stercorea DSM 18206]
MGKMPIPPTLFAFCFYFFCKGTAFLCFLLKIHYLYKKCAFYVSRVET